MTERLKIIGEILLGKKASGSERIIVQWHLCI